MFDTGKALHLQVSRIAAVRDYSSGEDLSLDVETKLEVDVNQQEYCTIEVETPGTSIRKHMLLHEPSTTLSLRAIC